MYTTYVAIYRHSCIYTMDLSIFYDYI